MKTKANMNMSERDNFYRDVVNYINDNLAFIKEGIKSTDPAVLAQASLDHYNHYVEASGNEDDALSDEQIVEFLAIAKRLFTQGYVEHAGSLKG